MRSFRYSRSRDRNVAVAIDRPRPSCLNVSPVVRYTGAIGCTLAVVSKR